MKISLKQLKQIINSQIKILNEDVFDLKNKLDIEDLNQYKLSREDDENKIYPSFEQNFSQEQHGNMVIVKIDNPSFFDMNSPFFSIIKKAEIKNKQIKNIIKHIDLDKKIILVNHHYYKDLEEKLKKDPYYEQEMKNKNPSFQNSKHNFFSGNYIIHDLAHTILTGKLEEEIDKSISGLQREIKNLIKFINSDIDLNEIIRAFFDENLDLNLSSDVDINDNPFGVLDKFPNLIKHVKQEKLNLQILNLQDLQDYIKKTLNHEINLTTNPDIEKEFNGLKSNIQSYFDALKDSFKKPEEKDQNYSVVHLIGIDANILKQE